MELNLIMVTTLETLLDAGGRVNITDLTERLRISRRTLSYNLSKLNYTLAKDGYAQIVQMDKQLLLDQNGLDQLRGWLSKQPLTDYVLSRPGAQAVAVAERGVDGRAHLGGLALQMDECQPEYRVGRSLGTETELGEYGLTFSRQGRRGVSNHGR